MNRPLTPHDPPGRDGRRASDREHVLDRLLAGLGPGRPPRPLGRDEMERAVAHLMSCAACTAGLSVLVGALDAPDLDALRAHTQPGLVPDEVELAFYAATAADEGAAAAARHYPAVARHVAACPLCRAAIDDALGMMVQVAEAPVVADDAIPAAAPVWRRLGDRVQRLIEPYEVRVRRLSLRISSALAQPQIETTFAGNARFLDESTDGGDGEPRQLAQRFAVDLSADRDAPRPWVRARVSLEARYTMRVKGRIETRLVASSDDEGEPRSDVAWRIERLAADGAREPVDQGRTGPRGTARFSIKGFADYLLTLETEGRAWEVPLTLLPDQQGAAGAGGPEPVV